MISIYSNGESLILMINSLWARSTGTQ